MEQPELPGMPQSWDPGTIALSEILRENAVVDVIDGMVLVAPKNGMEGAEERVQLYDELARFPELGYSSPSPYTSWIREEWNPKLRDKMGISEYYRMKRIDGIIRSSLRVFKTAVLGAHWFFEPADDSARSKNAAEFCTDNLLNGMNRSWNSFLEDALLMCDYGHMPFEKVYEFDSDGKIRLRKLAPRHPADIQSWKWDANGGPAGIVMEPNGHDGGDGPSVFGTAAGLSNDISYQPYNSSDTQPIFIPISKLVVFTLEGEAGDLRGLSILRSAYMHYQYKSTLYKIDAIQKERHGIGVPVIKLPPGFSPQDKAVAENLGRNLRTNERAHVTLPPQWELIFAKLEGQPVDCMKSIEHHNLMIMTNVIAPFLTESNTRKESLEMFYKSSRYVADTITDTMNRHVIEDLIKYNFVRVKPPKLRARRIGEWEDMRTMSFSLRNMTGAGLIVPDEPLEKFLRSEMDLPPADPDTARPMNTPQLNPAGPARVGPPRQGAAPTGVQKSNAGIDRSGN
jgi:hypothetical protein